MNKPTEEQIKEFWEWCGARCIKCSHLISNTIKADMCCCHTFELDLDLNNLFEYAVPIIHNKLGDEACYDLMCMWVRDNVFGKDPALALFWAIWQAKSPKEKTLGSPVGFVDEH